MHCGRLEDVGCTGTMGGPKRGKPDSNSFGEGNTRIALRESRKSDTVLHCKLCFTYWALVLLVVSGADEVVGCQCDACHVGDGGDVTPLDRLLCSMEDGSTAVSNEQRTGPKQVAV